MDKIKKALKKLSARERAVVEDMISRIIANEVAGLNIQKLIGYTDIFRLRKGDLRIIYRKIGNQFYLLAVDKRSEKTYRDF